MEVRYSVVDDVGNDIRHLCGGGEVRVDKERFGNDVFAPLLAVFCVKKFPLTFPPDHAATQAQFVVVKNRELSGSDALIASVQSHRRMFA